MEHSESIANLASALAKAQLEFPEIPKTKEGKVKGEGKNGSFEYSYKYADLGDVVPKVVPVLEKHGLSYTQFPDVNQRGDDGLTTVLLHESGEWLSGFMRLYLAKTTSQGHGSAITYARRYALCAALGIVADEDDDGRVATQQQKSQQKQQTKARSQGGNASRSGGAAANGTGNQAIEDRINALPEDQQGVIRGRISDNNFPSPLPGGAVKVVEKWLDEVELERPF